MRGVLLALTHLDPRGELHDGERPVFADRCPQRLGIPDIAADQRAPAHRMFMAAAQIIEDDRRMSCEAHGLGRVAADIAGAADDQDTLLGHRERCSTHRHPRAAASG